MDMVRLATELNSLAIKDLNRFQILSIFAEANWSINSDDINSLRLARYIESNLEQIITTATKSKWVFFTDITYGITELGINEWNELVSKVDATEESIRALLMYNNTTKDEIENIIARDWLSTSFYVMSRDIIHHVFNQDDVGTFFTTLKISEAYSDKFINIKSYSRLSGRYDIDAYYDKHDQDFWINFLILDLISDGELNFNFNNESNNYVDYIHGEPMTNMPYTESFTPAEIDITDSIYDLGPTRDIEEITKVKGVDVASTEYEMNDEYGQNEIINTNDAEILSNSVNIDVLYTNSDPEDIKSSYDLRNSTDYESD